MSEAQDEQLVSIGDMVATLAGDFPDVTPSSLRFLEREGLVTPRRTPGGHRLYGPEQIERVRRIKQWQRARLSLAEIRERLAAADDVDAPDQLAARFVGAALDGDGHAARAAVLAAYETGLPLQTLYDGVLRPALYEVGRRWAAGELGVAQEHEVSALVRDLIGELSARILPSDGPRPVAVAACVPGELHDLGLRMAAHLLEDRGYTVHFLGANTPVEAILHALRLRRAALLLLSVTQAHHVPALEATLRAVGTLPAADRPRVLVGGQAIAARPADVRRLGGEPVLDGLPGTALPTFPNRNDPAAATT